ncbi:MAG: Gldg family protein [Bdellovibrionales bacterium]|nr:Gldg family protein [Bdellovibrionales bacterium]
MKSKIDTVVRKEFSTYFSSPLAFIFLGTYLLVSLFVFFWVARFFSRNIVDVRPLFEHMPLLLVFLVAALTMKMWSEERRMGTLEFLMTMPVKTHHLVLGKFFACLGLVAVAIFLTIGVPITVSFMGDLDFGPVFGAYVGALLLASAYIAIGLYVSSKNESQISSLIITSLLCGIFYLLGSASFGELFGNRGVEIAKLLGSGSRFESISRGVIDIRDLYYYLSITGVFLALNTFSLEKMKWSLQEKKPSHFALKSIIALLVANFVLANFWLQKTHFARVDLTEGQIYSISPATLSVIDQLQEPLLIRGYFSDKTHPLLAPLVPEIRDLILEYGIAGRGKVRTEFVDPKTNDELEEEANRKYNIKPLPFQTSDKYEASLVNSYFNVLIQYGDQFEVLGFRELIEVKADSPGEVDVKLRNLEYDITRSIKKVLYGFQNTDTLFAGLSKPVQFTAYVSSDAKLPSGLVEFKAEMAKVLKEYETNSDGKFQSRVLDPDGGDGQIAKEISELYGFRPMKVSLFDTETFYFYMLIEGAGQNFIVPLPENLSAEGLKQGIEATLKRLSPGFLKTIGLVAPQGAANPYLRQMGMDNGKQFEMLKEKLQENYIIQDTDLKSGVVPDSVDLLLVAAPKELDSKSLFAVDQFLMKGGTVLLATSPFTIEQSESGVKADKISSGLSAWLNDYGIEVLPKLVLDPQNENYPVPVQRNVGGFTVQEIKMVNYPFFVDVRGQGLNSSNEITSGVPQVTLNWPSPIRVDVEKNKDRNVIELLKSSERSWATDSTELQPNFAVFGELGFAQDAKTEMQTLGVIVEGKFDSFYKGKDSPLLEAPSEKKDGEKANEKKDEEQKPAVITNVIEKSPESARIILFSSNDFLADQTLQISAAIGSSRFMNSLQLVENALDWSLEDRALLSIRSRGHFSRTILPMSSMWKMFYEYLNYALVLFGLLCVYLVSRFLKSQARDRYKGILAA